MAFQPKQKEFKSKKGNKYVFQTIPNSKYLEIMDETTTAEGKPLLSKLYAATLENIVVQPSGLTVDDFDSFKELQEVCEAALTFQQSE
ncbi:hypothetical protein [Geobacillus stearothermophilus]|uniref:Phage protein n=1 Tax=Geobacillus stearothermophilus TaxID=1422 RepID=A0A150MUL6_GEOSE|nr:hypothetical protein [Geobacillus stearothermophilus]KYD28173.1 hypothetical protein B4109_3074 [Geobacillus stearothermophilus]